MKLFIKKLPAPPKPLEPQNQWTDCRLQLPPWEESVLFCRLAEGDTELNDETGERAELLAGKLISSVASASGVTLNIDVMGKQTSLAGEGLYWSFGPWGRKEATS